MWDFAFGTKTQQQMISHQVHQIVVHGYNMQCKQIDHFLFKWKYVPSLFITMANVYTQVLMKYTTLNTYTYHFK